MSVAAARPAGEMVSFETNLAPLRLRLAALGLDVALLAALAAAITLGANAALGRFTGDVFSPFWRDLAPVAVESRPAGERELDALGDGRSLHDRLSGTRVVRAEAALRARVAPA